MTRPRYWLIKSEPDVYPYSQLESEGRTAWTGIRSFEARNNLRKMQPGDLALYYHSGDAKEIVGIARVATAAGPDPTAPDEDWASVDVTPATPFTKPVSLAALKAAKELKQLPLITRGRLSVVPIAPEHFRLILKMGATKAPKQK
jgi:predicted RNA-binding protein with PUA-like domain